MFCPNCGKEILKGQKFCPFCGYQLNETFAKKSSHFDGEEVKKSASKISKQAVSTFTRNLSGNEETDHVDLHLRDCFSSVFKKHTKEEEEKIFLSGKTAHVNLSMASEEWPKPWLYSRVLIFLLLATIILAFLVFRIGNSSSLPLYMVISSLIGPLSVLTFFYEVNVPRNISFIEVIKIFIIGGILSIIATLVIGKYTGEQEIASAYSNIPFFVAIAIALVEELAKALIDAIYINKISSKRFILNAMLVGAAVGAGFSAFETVGYDFNAFLYTIINYFQKYNISTLEAYNTVFSIANNEMNQVILIRALTSIGGHMVWSAITAAALVIASKGDKVEASTFINSKFLSIAVIPVLLHAIWDWDIPINDNLKMVILIALVWVVALILIGRGIREVNIIGKNSDLGNTK